MAKEKKIRKARTVDLDERLKLVDDQIERFSNLVSNRKALLEKTETLAQERREALAKTEQKLSDLQGKRSRIINLKERREAKAAGVRKPSPKQAEMAALAEIKQKMAEKGLTLDDIMSVLGK